jgi:endonuclease III
MAAKNRAALINKVLKVVKKHYKPATLPKDRSLLQHLIYACLLENSLQDAAEKTFQSLSTDYFDWNEVRVSTVKELADVCKPLNDPSESATRLKRVLQSVFETHYSFDLEPLKKQNIGVAVKTLEKYNGSTPFVVAYVTQQALGGHSIPINQGLLQSMHVVGVVSDSEAAKGVVPGLERIVPKSKGAEVGTQLHQLGVEMFRSPYGPTIRKMLLEIEPDAKDNLPKRPKPAEEAPAAQAPGKNGTAAAAPVPAAPAKAGSTKAVETLAKKTAAKKPAEEPAKAAPTKKPVKKVLKKKVKASSGAGVKKKTTATKRLTKRKPR